MTERLFGARAAARHLAVALSRAVVRLVLAALIHGAFAIAQDESCTIRQEASPCPPVENPGTNSWAFAASVYGYFVPDSRDYAQPTVTADRGWLHLEGRYNYESLNTGSAWFGYNLGGGQKIEWSFTPMIGGVFGDLNGIAPGYEFSVTWWKLELYSEGECVFDLGDAGESFFYNWSEFSMHPTEWFRFGIATQRTRLYESDRDIQRGFLVGATWKRVDFTTYVFNPGANQPTFVLALGVGI